MPVVQVPLKVNKAAGRARRCNIGIIVLVRVAVCEGMHGFPGEKEGAVTQYFMLLHHEQAAEANDQV